MNLLAPITISLALASCAAASTPELRVKDSVVSLGNAERHWCTGAVIGKETILTAEHCVPAERPVTHVNGKPVTVVVVARDGKDHVLLRTSPLPYKPLKVNLTHVEVTERVFLWGYAEGLQKMYRTGVYSGDYVDEKEKYYLYDIEIIFGDSGSPIFNSKGEVVSTLNIIHQFQLVYRMGGSQPWAFTKAQWSQVK